jgi:prepilin-type N-terminal cleavage/methylation domain-containing protein
MPGLIVNIPNQTSKTEGGFTLIEVLISIAIFAVGFLAVWQMQIRAVNSNALGRDILEAATLAGSRTEDILALPYNDSALNTITHTDPGQPPYGVEWTVYEDEGIFGLKQIDLTVDWGTHNVPVTTYLVDHP